jgi:hypothetical protein
MKCRGLQPTLIAALPAFLLCDIIQNVIGRFYLPSLPPPHTQKHAPLLNDKIDRPNPIAILSGVVGEGGAEPVLAYNSVLSTEKHGP